ncbi:MAG: class I SAM-dependent methyltransferase [Acidobacteriota bacterium]|nr:class I SAM-dependent methyltransferase [Acidobacteriota bacterium]
MDQRSRLFEQRLETLKAALEPSGIVWYPYRTLAVFSILDKLLTGPRRKLIDLAGGDPILDLGCGDGALSFFFESLGCDVRAMDNHHTNHNHMRGFLELRSALNSSVKLEMIDMDSQFQLPEEIFGLAVFLGVFYHLKNPFYALETLAARARYCLFSTRIARRTPSGTRIKDEPLAYLLDSEECNNDSTNFWVFSETALRRALDRTGWIVRDFITTGDTRGSEPARLDRDERAFCLLESRVCPLYSVKLLEGWHPLEQSSFRWTERRFALELKRPPSSKLRFNFKLMFPGPVTLSARVNGKETTPVTFTGEDDHSFEIDLPHAERYLSPIRIDFAVDKGMPPVEMDTRELALLVAFWRPGLDRADPILPFEL